MLTLFGETQEIVDERHGKKNRKEKLFWSDRHLRLQMIKNTK